MTMKEALKSSNKIDVEFREFEEKQSLALLKNVDVQRISIQFQQSQQTLPSSHLQYVLSSYQNFFYLMPFAYS